MPLHFRTHLLGTGPRSAGVFARVGSLIGLQLLRRPWSAVLLAACFTASTWALAALWYVGSERAIYVWDHLMWWIWSVQLANFVVFDIAAGARQIWQSLQSSNYPVIPAIPIALWMVVAGVTRLPFVLGIAVIWGSAGGAALASLSQVAVGRVGSRTPPRAARLVAVAVPIITWLLWPLPFVGAMRGFPDVGAVAISYAILAVYFASSDGAWNLRRNLTIGVLLATLFLFRRPWSYWIVSFGLLVVLDALLAASRRRHESREILLRTLLQPVMIGVTAASTVLIVARPLVTRVAATDFADIYSGYQAKALEGWWGNAAQTVTDLVQTNGVIPTLLGIAALGMLLAAPATRRVGLFLTVLFILPHALLRRVQAPGMHHHLIWCSSLTAATALAGAAVALRLQPREAVLLLAGVSVAGCAQWAGALVPAASAARWLVFGNEAQLPLVRHDLGEFERLVQTIDACVERLPSAPKIYCLASSSVLNANALFAYPVSVHKPFSAALLVANTADVDKRDGFPNDLVTSDLVIVTDPPQVHLDPADQQVVVIPAMQILAGTGFGEPFTRLPAEFTLDGGVKVFVYARTQAMMKSHVRALCQALEERYPDRPFIHTYNPGR